MKMKTFIKAIKNITVKDFTHGDIKLNVWPLDQKKPVIPEAFNMWNDQILDLLSNIPFQEGNTQHYLTIDSKFFTTDDYLRREGLHVDGNFCADPTFKYDTWGGTRLRNGKVESNFTSPYNTEIPIGKYISEDKGGILCASSYEGCVAWEGDIHQNVGNEGSYNKDYLLDSIPHVLKKNMLYFMTSNTPHETLITPKGTRRTFIRITLNHNYDNYLLGLIKNES